MAGKPIRAVRSTKADEDSTAVPRKASREQRRQQFIDATIAILAQRGYAKTTLTDVANSVGLSHGLIIFHFESKDKLFTETLLYLADEYRQNWLDALAAGGATPQGQLFAMICADFSSVVCTPDRLAAWSAFRGEAQSRPIYRQYCSINEMEYFQTLMRLCAALIAEGGYPWQADLVARVISVTLEGIWLDMLMMADPYAPQEAIRTVLHSMAAFFPKHFSVDGPLYS